MARTPHTAIILAAGMSSRMGGLTARRPKTLLSVAGHTLLDRIFASLEGAGIRKALVVTGYCSEKIEDHVRSVQPGLSVSFVRNARYRTTSNNISLLLALSELGAQPFLLTDSDILFDPVLIPLLLQRREANALILRQTKRMGTEEIKVETNVAGRILRIGKDIPVRRAAGESIGIEKFSAGAAARLFTILKRRSRKREFYEASFQELINHGTPIYAVPSGSVPCVEIDTPADLRTARRMAGTFRL